MGNGRLAARPGRPAKHARAFALYAAAGDSAPTESAGGTEERFFSPRSSVQWFYALGVSSKDIAQQFAVRLSAVSARPCICLSALFCAGCATAVCEPQWVYYPAPPDPPRVVHLLTFDN